MLKDNIDDQFYMRVLDTLGAVVMIIDAKGNILKMNATAENFMGYTTCDIQHQPYFWERFIPEYERSRVHNIFESMRAHNIPREAENHWVSNQGETRLFHWINTVMDNSFGEPEYLITIGMDVTEQRFVTDALRRSRDFHRLLSHVRDAITNETEENELFQRVCDFLIYYTQGHVAWVIRPDDEGWFQLLAASGEVGYLNGIRISNRGDLPEGSGPVGRAWRTQQPIFDDAITIDSTMEPWRTRIDDFGMKRTTTLPLKRNGQIWAIMAISHREDTNFDEELQHLLMELADSVSLGLTRLDVFRKNQELFSINLALTNGTTSGIGIVRYPERVFEQVNQRMAEIVGAKSIVELVNKATRDYYPDQTTYERVASLASEVLNRGTGVLRDTPFLRLDGVIVRVDLMGIKMEPTDVSRVIWTFVDVTERHNLDHALRRSREFHALLSHANENIAQAIEEKGMLQQICELAIHHTNLGLVWIGKPDGEGWFQFHAASGEIGYLNGIRISNRGDIPEGKGPVGRAWRMQQPIFYNDIEDTPSMTPWKDRIIQFGLKSSASLPIYRRGQIWGILIVYHIEEDVFEDYLQEILIDLARDIGYGLDRIDLAIQERQASHLNDILLSSMNAGINVMRYPERLVETVNPKMIEIYGAKSVSDLMGHSVREAYPNETAFQRVGEFAKLVLKNGKGSLSDIPYRRMDGKIIYIDLSGQKFDRGDGIDRIIWTHVDVTERHLHEQQILELSQQKSLLLDNTIAGIDVVQYPERVIAEANQRFAELMGFDHPEEVIGMPTVKVYPDYLEYQRMAELSQTVIEQGQGFLRDLIIRTRDGEKKYLDISGVLLNVNEEHSFVIWTTVDVTERHSLMEQLEQKALFDSLTGLPNRRYLENQLDLALAEADRGKNSLVVVLVDLDGFKTVNDSHGHNGGDRVLQIVGERFQKVLRQNDFIARMGGDEFVLILTDIQNSQQITEILYRIQESITAPIQLSKDITVEVGLSAGICPYPLLGISGSNTVLRLADQALYKSKDHKKNREKFWVMANLMN